MVVTLTARHYADLARVTGRTEALAAVERALGADFARDSDRYAHREVIAALLAPWFADHTTDEVTSALAGTSVLWERYRTFADLAADPETLANPLVSLHRPAGHRRDPGHRHPAGPARRSRKLPCRPRSSARTRKPCSVNFAKAGQ